MCACDLTQSNEIPKYYIFYIVFKIFRENLACYNGAHLVATSEENGSIWNELAIAYPSFKI